MIQLLFPTSPFTLLSLFLHQKLFILILPHQFPPSDLMRYLNSWSFPCAPYKCVSLKFLQTQNKSAPSELKNTAVSSQELCIRNWKIVLDSICSFQVCLQRKRIIFQFYFSPKKMCKVTIILQMIYFEILHSYTTCRAVLHRKFTRYPDFRYL